jgi:hypothetical protein
MKNPLPPLPPLLPLLPLLLVPDDELPEELLFLPEDSKVRVGLLEFLNPELMVSKIPLLLGLELLPDPE